MATILHVDFAKRSRAYTREPADKGPTDFKQLEAEVVAAMFASGLDTDPETLAWFYESSLGYVAPESDPA